jgi:hypothetical protein
MLVNYCLFLYFGGVIFDTLVLVYEEKFFQNNLQQKITMNWILIFDDFIQK